ncbi:MAG: hypothetical protein P0Y49_15480 [Candidatus Pedobacter colombiensis]|uniref:Uncharacterized protein n=1 Tax=Candidatus Pedobacter colombiensis TaxID=3121371 RepID=A0AAJ5W803_9SPHI|nr:hypothetical protein [Pedobacter sp.]WEK18192.1 MAG: hypothetical protein P0Y49_15480 [Pedobacter sp.]
MKKKIIKYPENLHLKDFISQSGISIKHLANEIGISREVLSNTVNGHYKGGNIVPQLLMKLGITEDSAKS